LEGRVVSRRIAEVLPGELRDLPDLAVDQRRVGLVSGEVRPRLQELMSNEAGVLRTATGLTAAITELAEIAGEPAPEATPIAWENANLASISAALATAAFERQETRGSHWREDFPDRDDARWSGHFDSALRDGVLTVTYEENR
jgi:L-aspartate oxidase